MDQSFYAQNVINQLQMVQDLLLESDPVEGQRVLADLFRSCQARLNAGSAFDPDSQDPDAAEVA